MYLKSIEIQGFKSFANKIEFKFHNGITAIVGPNGSGKSNVADAVRWVLGEQKIKQLRGHSMQDVIFAGTELRRPLGFAYVAITLDNSDHVLPVSYDEVTVARRLYRSGESEYMINGLPCRLRDINEMFYDTGIGKEGYSIIGQGQIDRILSNKPEDRRELFDEAAGIVKFKRRKMAAVRKLDSEKENLVRIGDILSELERQVGPLEKQSQKAKIYLDTREEMKGLEVNVFLMDNQAHTARLEELDEKEEIARDDLEEARERYDLAGEEYRKIQEEIADTDRKIGETRDRIAGADIVRSKLEADISLFEEQISSARQTMEHYEGRRSRLQDQMDRQQEEFQAIQGRAGEMEQELERLRRERREAFESLCDIQARALQVNDRLEQARNGLLHIIEERGSLKSRQAGLAARQEENRKRREELAHRIDRIQDSEQEQEQKIREYQDQFEEISGRIVSLRQEQKETAEAIDSKKPLLTAADQDLRRVQLAYHQEKSRLDALINMTERYEGFGGSVRRVMEEKKREPGLIGVVADLFKTDKKYETAIEVALGGRIQNIVTDNAATAGRMIRMLKDSKAGRATFLPLSDIEEGQSFRDPRVLGEEGVIGPADSLLQTEQRFRPVASYLLGRIIIVDTYDRAVSIRRKYGSRISMVTLEGEQFTPGGAISGGSFRSGGNLLGRRREMAELRDRIARYEKEQEQIEDRIEEIKKDRTGLRARAETLRMELQRCVLAQNTARMNIITEQEKQKETAGSREEILREQQELEVQTAALEEELKAAGRAISQSGSREETLTGDADSLEEELDALQQAETDQQAVVSKWELELQKADQQAAYERQNADRIRQELEDLRTELTEAEEGIRRARQNITEKEKAIEETRDGMERGSGQRDQEKALLRRYQEQREGLDVRQKKCFSDRENLAARTASLDKELLRLTSAGERIREKVDSLVSYMWEEYGLTMSEAAALRDPSLTDLTAMRGQVSRLKRRIKDLGSVNVNAIEEYRELMERYTFQKRQYDDLTDATGKLEKIIEELDEAMRRQFKEEFQKIMTEFDRVFKELFGGGSGRLELMEDMDILEAGVRVIAQPPGKKLQNMMQLSGGEKALTAISLLFAIQNLKPSPFCLLDEIEAALDESNVTRFSGYLHKLTEHTQFIVITHRRGTMEEADRLYGITMQEKGVSALVSVSLVEASLDD